MKNQRTLPVSREVYDEITEMLKNSKHTSKDLKGKKKELDEAVKGIERAVETWISINQEILHFSKLIDTEESQTLKQNYRNCLGMLLMKDAIIIEAINQEKYLPLILNIIMRRCADLNCKNVFYTLNATKKYCSPACENRARQKRHQRKTG